MQVSVYSLKSLTKTKQLNILRISRLLEAPKSDKTVTLEEIMF